MLTLNNEIPSLTKYMGSKAEIIDYVVKGLNDIHKANQDVCDLFAGSSTLAGALRNNPIKFISNDIQIYSSVFSSTYFNKYNWDKYPSAEEIIDEVRQIVLEWIESFSDYWNKCDYNRDFTLKEFNELEIFQQELNNNRDFIKKIQTNQNRNIRDYNLFTKCYSGTYFSFRQCIWIDALRLVADRYKSIDELYNLILATTMYSMAYNSQSTGHYAQYRKADKESSKDDILKYRRVNIDSYFIRKYEEIKKVINNNCGELETYSLSYEECLDIIDSNTLVYADPPYCQVHYSRFYHILETFVKYDYPELKFGGRYRIDRHQSPFCISTKVRGAFRTLFEKIKTKESELVLSYSNSSTSMIGLETICLDAYNIFNDLKIEDELTLDKLKSFIIEQEKIQIESNSDIGNKKEINININKFFLGKSTEYEITLKMFEHIHSTMGRREKKENEVLETLILVNKK